MPEDRLPLAAEAFLVHWEASERVNPIVMRQELAALLDEVRAEERERCAKVAAACREFIREHPSSPKGRINPLAGTRHG